MIKVSHLKFIRCCCTDDRCSKPEVSVARECTHSVGERGNDVDFAVAGYIRQSQSVRRPSGKNDVRHANKVLASVISENKDVRFDKRTGFFFGQDNVQVAVAIEIGSIDGSFAAGENLCYNRGSECPVAVVQSRTEMI